MTCAYCREGSPAPMPLRRQGRARLGRPPYRRRLHLSKLSSMVLHSSAILFMSRALFLVSSIPIVYGYSFSSGVSSSARCVTKSASPLLRNCIQTAARRGNNPVGIRPGSFKLFSAINDGVPGVTNELLGLSMKLENSTSLYMSPNQSTNSIDEKSLDNLLPSTMNINMKGIASKNARTGAIMRRRPRGVSSSVLLPSLESSSLEFATNPNSVRSSTFVNDNNLSGNEGPPTSWKERLVDVSNIASFLCVLDCTLLPLVSIAIPALSWAVGLVAGMAGAPSASSAASTNTVMIALSSIMATIPAIGHGIALYFVIPVGLLTTVVNYVFGHKELRFSVPALLGIMLIYTANSNGLGIPYVDSWLASVGIIAQTHTHAHGTCASVGHVCAEGWAHRMTNTLGCAFLLGSNYASRKFMEEKSQGCAATALAEAWGGEGAARRAVCPPGCNCETPVSFGTGGNSSTRLGGEAFFQWEEGGKRK